MNELIELLFEEVPVASMNGFLSSLLDGREVFSSSFSEDDVDRRNFTDFDYRNFLTMRPSVPKTLSIRLDALSIGSIQIKKPLVQAIFHNSILDVSISFLKDDFSSKNDESFAGLMREANFHAKKYEVKIFMCGYEPAVDDETRFFTNTNMGPIFS